MKKNKFILKDIDTLTDEFIGKRGTPAREKFEYELRMDILGSMIKEARKRKKLSQEQLGALVGVQKAQISKIENNTKNFRLVTILPVMDETALSGDTDRQSSKRPPSDAECNFAVVDAVMSDRRTHQQSQVLLLSDIVAIE